MIGVINTIGIYETIIMVAQPIMLKSILPIIMAMGSILYGYTMIQKTNKFTYIFMIFSLVIIAIVALYNLMIHFSLNIGL